MSVKLDSLKFDNYIKESAVPVLVDFYNDSCIPCRRIAPVLSKAETEYENNLSFARVNIGMNTDLISKYEIEAAPTLIIFKGGEEINRHRGVLNFEELKDFIETVL